MPQSSGFSQFTVAVLSHSLLCSPGWPGTYDPCLCWAHKASVYTRAISPVLCLEFLTPCSGLMPLECWVKRPASPASPRRLSSTWAPASSHSDWFLRTSREVIQAPLSISPLPSAGLMSLCNTVSWDQCVTSCLKVPFT